MSKEVLSEGTGVTPQEGHTVFAHYTGTLENGEVFDSSRGKPHRAEHGFYFTLGAGEVIRGWDVGLESISGAIRPARVLISRVGGREL